MTMLHIVDTTPALAADVLFELMGRFESGELSRDILTHVEIDDYYPQGVGAVADVAFTSTYDVVSFLDIIQKRYDEREENAVDDAWVELAEDFLCSSSLTLSVDGKTGTRNLAECLVFNQEILARLALQRVLSQLGDGASVLVA